MLNFESQMDQQKNQITDEYPLLVAHNLDPEIDDTGDQIFYPLHDPMSHYRCRIPELVGRRIRATSHGWMILSKSNPQDIEWSFWNPVNSKLIHLPPLILEEDDEDDFRHCCLTSPPDDDGGNSILLLMRSTEPVMVIFNYCNSKSQSSESWMEMSYSEDMKEIKTNFENDYPVDDDDEEEYLLFEPTCCNGNIYAWSNVRFPGLLIQIQITTTMALEIEEIELLPLVKLPWSDWENRIEDYFFLKGSSCKQELFIISLCVEKELKKKLVPCDVHLFKLDMSSMKWTELKDDDESVFFVSFAAANDDLVYSSPQLIKSGLGLGLGGGGYIHILEGTRQVIYSFNIKDKTITMSSMHCLDLPPCSISIWTMPTQLIRLHGKANCKVDGHDDDDKNMVRSSATTMNDDDDDDETKDDVMNNIPFDVLETIMKFCVGIEYLNFRATCKHCRLAAPMIQWSNETKRLQTYSLVSSPWLMVIHKDQEIVTFTDPMFGDTYSMKPSPPAAELLLSYHRILCSRYGWLLLSFADDYIAFFNPFTSEIRKLTVRPLGGLESYSFSALPTSPDCMVVAFLQDRYVAFHRLASGEPSWHVIALEHDLVDNNNVVNNPHNNNYFEFPVFCGEDVYTLCGGRLEVFRGMDSDDENDFSWKRVVDAPRSTSTTRAKYFQAKCDGHDHHLLVMVEEFGKSVKVFKLNVEKDKNNPTREWEEIDGLGRHVIYICDTSCVCMDAKTPEMENKIYFPRLHKNGKILFYSLETRMFHTFNGSKKVEQSLTDLFGTKRTVYTHVWIEPTWS
ncbi:hypothetical protein L6452_36546 [Arctium lappa]|uniref:Uncharacterized protein n=1 Tax=Arctium lappa TaxID=4217 RepID=A0ACB8YAZ5_ARCLA|nr:hypothetical protein L6452_36546 [Arctium lappa]